MKKLDVEEIVLQLMFFLAGIYIIYRILTPIINPASIAAASASVSSGNGNSRFYSEILRQSSSSINQLPYDSSENSSNIRSLIFTYLTGIDFENPLTYLSTQINLMSFVDVVSMEPGEQAPVAYTPDNKDTSENPGKDNKTGNDAKDNDSKTPDKDNKNSTDELKTLKPNNIEIKKTKLDNKKPLVLIYHTHTTESFKPDNNGENYARKNPELTVDEVGNKLEYELEAKYGIATLHDSTIHDLPKMLGAYDKSRKTVQKYLKKYPSLKLIIDLHRDGEVPRSSCTVIIDKENYARTLLVAGSNFSKYKKYNETTLAVKKIFDTYYPELCKGVVYKKSHSYNQDLSSKMILLEIGSNDSKLYETFNTTKLVAKVIAKYLGK